MFVCAECGASSRTEGLCTADGTPLSPIGEDILLGTTIGAYRIARLLGIGGMGRVYKGVQPTIGSRVAIKVLSRECSDRRDLVERFFAEAKAVNLIRHESIVNVLDLATLPDGRPYIVMEYLDGAPLASQIEQAQQHGTPLPLGGVARLAAEVLDALSAAHAKGIIHRDLKPDNVFVTPQGRAKVLDFGIAKLRPELGGSSTHTGSLLGTPHYMSPEQASGRPVDQRADLYAIGVILFECATLHKPFVADSLFDLLRKHVEAPPPSPRALRRDMPPELERVIFTALAKQPEQRFASAQAMSVALQHATAQLPPEQWTPITPVPRTTGAWAPPPPASWGGTTHPSTTAAGQMVGSAKKASRKGLWIAIAAVLLVGGGITAAVVAGGGSGSASAPVATAAPPVAKPPANEDTEDVTKALAEAESETKAALAQLPPDQRAMIDNQLGQAHQQIAAALATTGGWVTNTQLDYPGFDPAHLDGMKALAFALAQAKQLVPDAQLFRIDADGMYADGHADLTETTNGSLDFRFISPSRTKRDPSVPIGGKQEKKCMFRVIFEQDGAMAMPINGFDCKEPLIGPPRCSFAAAWQKAIARKAANNAIASMGYRSNSSGPTWYFDIHDVDHPFSDMLRDDCK